MNDDFEQRLSRQPLRQIPSGWREAILGATRQAQSFYAPSFVVHRSKHPFLNERLAAILWPHPKAWAALAAIWIFIIVLNFSIRDKSPVRAEKALPPSPQVIVELRKQQLLFAELLGPREEPVADRSKTHVPHSRSGRAEWLVG